MSIICKPTATELIPLGRDICLNIWDTDYEEISQAKGVWYKTMQPRPPRMPWFDGAGLSNLLFQHLELDLVTFR